MAKLYHLFFLTIFVVIIPTLVHANLKEQDSFWEGIFPSMNNTYWRGRAARAQKANDKAYTPDPYAVSEEEWKNWQWRSINDVYMNGAFFRQAGPELTNRPFSRKDMIKARPGTFVGRLTRYSGSLRCIVGKPC